MALLLAPASPSSPAFANNYPSAVLPQEARDSKELLISTIRAKNLAAVVNGERIDLIDLEELLDFTAREMIGELSNELLNVELAAQRNLYSLTANQVAKWYGRSDRETVNGNVPLFKPDANTLLTHRETLRRVYFGTHKETLPEYNAGFATHCVYATSAQKAVIGRDDITKANNRNIALAPPLKYEVNYLNASGNLGQYNLNNILPNGDAFNMGSFNAVQPKEDAYLQKAEDEGNYNVKIDSLDQEAESLVLKYILKNPFKMIVRWSRWLLCIDEKNSEPFQLPLTPDPLPYSYNAAALAKEAFAKRRIVLFQGDQELTPEQLLQEIESTAEAIADSFSNAPLDEEMKAFQAQIQLNLKRLTAYKAAKQFAGVKLPAVKGEAPLFNTEAESLKLLGRQLEFLLLNSDNSRKDEFYNLMADNVTYVEGFFATTGKEAVTSFLSSDPLRTHPFAEISIDSRTIEKNLLTSSQTFTLQNGDKFKVFYTAFLNTEGKITFLNVNYNRKAVLEMIRKDTH